MKMGDKHISKDDGPKQGDWRIDTSAGGPILVYKNCSVIESEQAEYVMRLIAADNAQPAQGERTAGPIYSDDPRYASEIAGLDAAWKDGICHAVGEYAAAKIAWMRRAALSTKPAQDEREAVLRDLIQHASEMSDHTQASWARGIHRLSKRARAALSTSQAHALTDAARAAASKGQKA